MATGRDPYKKAADVGSESPASEEAKEQGMAGDRGAEGEKVDATPGQPPQTSDRSHNAAHHQRAEVRRHYPEGHAPSEQGEKDHPSPDQIAQNQQGIGRRSGSNTGTDRSEARAQAGEPDEAHTREGRQKTPGDRAPNPE